MRGQCRTRAAELHAVMRTGMDERIGHDEIVGPRQRRDQSGIGGKAIGHEQGRLAAEDGGGLRLQRFMLGRIAAQQPRPPRADRHAARDRLAHCLRNRRVTREAEIVVGCEIMAARGKRRRSRERAASASS